MAQAKGARPRAERPGAALPACGKELKAEAQKAEAEKEAGKGPYFIWAFALLDASLLGDHSGRAPPGPIPNPEVKPPGADDSAAACRAKVGNRQAPSPGPGTRQDPGPFFAPKAPWLIHKNLKL
jgi:hypothetical protein